MQVIAVAFDSNRIISVGTDDTMRYWSFPSPFPISLYDQHHILLMDLTHTFS